MGQNCLQPEVGPEILFSVRANTVIASEKQIPLKSAPSDTTSSECVKHQTTYLKEQPSLGGTRLHHSLSPHDCDFFTRILCSRGLWYIRRRYICLHSISTGQSTFRGHFFGLQEMRFCDYGCSLYKHLNWIFYQVNTPPQARCITELTSPLHKRSDLVPEESL